MRKQQRNVPLIGAHGHLGRGPARNVALRVPVADLPKFSAVRKDFFVRSRERAIWRRDDCGGRRLEPDAKAGAEHRARRRVDVGELPGRQVQRLIVQRADL
jgi:hypothetical protein